MVIEKPEEAFNSQKDNQLNLTITKDGDIRLNVYEKQNKYSNNWSHWVYWFGSSFITFQASESKN